MVEIYGRESCPYCVKAKELADKSGIKYEYIDISKDGGSVKMLKDKGFRTIPQIFDDEKYIGGYTELEKYLS